MGPIQGERWGDVVGVEYINGNPYRMYAQRPRRLEALLPYANAWGALPHIIQSEKVVTFADALIAVSRKASQLQADGVRPGDRVFLLGWNSSEWIINFWSCVQIGAVPVLANTWWSAREIAAGLAVIKPALTLADPLIASKLPADTVLGSWESDFDADAQWAPPVTDGSEEDVALIIFTSGTSGNPKAVVLSHRALLARLQMTLHVTRKLPHQIQAAARDATLITGPLFHVGGMQTLLRAFVVGEALVFPRGRFDPGEVAQLIERHQIKRWNAVPTMVSRLLDHPGVNERDLSCLKAISIGGAPVHAQLMRRMREGLPGVSPRIPTGYGLTENGGQATASGGSEEVAQLGSTGRPLPCVEIKFLPHSGAPDGEVLLRSPTQMSGYFGLEASPIDKEGWLHTGDLGRLDANGNLWITGRCKDMIIRGGENIAPVSIERELMALAGVREATVFGLPHPDLGEEVMAVVVGDTDLTPEMLQQGLKGRVASFAIPSRWKIQQEALLTNQTGKVDKLAISATVRAEQQALRAEDGE